MDGYATSAARTTGFAYLSLECKRADEFIGAGHILSDILRGIGEAEIVIADLTNRNPNVSMANY